MKKFLFLISAIFITSSSCFAANSRNLTVVAAPNMAVALSKIAREFSRKNDTTISVNFALSYDLLDDADSGEPMDVLVTARTDLIDALKHRGLVDVHSAGYVAKDSLALVTNKNDADFNRALQQAPSLEEALRILDQKSIYLLVDQSESSSGRFAGDLLQSLNLSDLKLFNKVSEDRSPVIGTARKVEGGIYALLLTSQIKNEKDFTILSTKKDANIFYQALVIAGNNMEVGREFVSFLRGGVARKIFTDAGFESLE